MIINDLMGEFGLVMSDLMTCKKYNEIHYWIKKEPDLACNFRSPNMSLLHWASHHGDAELVELLLNLGMDPLEKTKSGALGIESSLDIAERKDHKKIIIMLKNNL